MENKEKYSEDEISTRFAITGIVQHIRHGKVTDLEAFDYIWKMCKEDKEDSPTIPLAEWVSVKDRLPEESGEVLIVTEARSVYVSHFKKSTNRFTAYGVESVLITDLKTTHWMPLPDTSKLFTESKEI